MPSAAPRRGRKPIKGLANTRRQHMSDAAIRVFAENGFHNTTLETIARAAGVSVGLIYRYFKDKEELLHHAILDIQSAWATAVPRATAAAHSPLERFIAGVHAYAKVIDDNRNVALLGYRASGLLSRRHLKTIMRRERETNQLLGDLVKECIEAETFRGIDAQMFTYQIIAFIHSWVVEAWRLPRSLKVAEFVDRGLALMLPAVLTPRASGLEPARALAQRAARHPSAAHRANGS